MAITQRLQRRLARLEQRRTAGDVAYIVLIGDEASVYDWHGQPVTLDEWRRRHPNAVDVEIGDMPYKLYKDFDAASV